MQIIDRSLRRPPSPWLALTLAALLLPTAARSQSTPGDANADGRVTGLDATPIALRVLGREAAPGPADRNGDGEVNLLDVACALQPGPFLTLLPLAADLRPGELQELNAFVARLEDDSVGWDISGGTLVGNGHFVFWSPPDVPGAYTVTATSVEDPSLSETATMTVTLAPRIRFLSDSSVIVSRAGDEVRFEVEVLGTDGLPLPDAEVTWTSSDGAIVSVAADGPRAAVATAETMPTGHATLTASYGGVEAQATVILAVPALGTVLVASSLIRTEPGTGDGSEVILDRTPLTESLGIGEVLVSSSLAVLDSPLLLNLDGLEGLTSIGGRVDIGGSLLADVSGLGNITTIGAGLYLENPPERFASLPTFEMASLVEAEHINIRGGAPAGSIGVVSFPALKRLTTSLGLDGDRRTGPAPPRRRSRCRSWRPARSGSHESRAG